MNVIWKVILAVYKFFVGDLVILIGTVLLARSSRWSSSL